MHYVNKIFNKKLYRVKKIIVKNNNILIVLVSNSNVFKSAVVYDSLFDEKIRYNLENRDIREVLDFNLNSIVYSTNQNKIIQLYCDGNKRLVCEKGIGFEKFYLSDYNEMIIVQSYFCNKYYKIDKKIIKKFFIKDDFIAIQLNNGQSILLRDNYLIQNLYLDFQIIRNILSFTNKHVIVNTDNKLYTYEIVRRQLRLLCSQKTKNKFKKIINDKLITYFYNEGYYDYYIENITTAKSEYISISYVISDIFLINSNWYTCVSNYSTCEEIILVQTKNKITTINNLEPLDIKVSVKFLNVKNTSVLFYENISNKKLIVMLEGGPHSNVLDEFSLLNSYFLKLGYSIAKVNYAGSNNGNKRNPTDIYNKISYYEIFDIESVLNYFEKLDFTDIIIVGHSYGGYLALKFSQETEKVNVSKVIAIAPIYNWKDLYDVAMPVSKKLIEAFHSGTPDKGNSLYEESKVDPQKKFKIETYVLHGKFDKIIPISCFQKFCDEVSEINSGRKIHTCMLPNSGHVIESEDMCFLNEILN